MNDTANFNGATVSAPFIGYAGAAPIENGATFKLAAPAPMLPVADPCTEIAGCSYLAEQPALDEPMHFIQRQRIHWCARVGLLQFPQPEWRERNDERRRTS